MKFRLTPRDTSFFATPSPSSAPTRFATAAMPSATRGVRAFVDTEVAIAFAVVRDARSIASEQQRKALEAEVMKQVDSQLGAVARPARVHFVTGLPKTRSGKLLRRSIQALAEGRDPGDLTTIEDPGALEQIRAALAPR